MSRKDAIHTIVVTALQRENWLITDDPYTLYSGGAKFKIDLGAEKSIIANRDKDKIVVEIKTFEQHSINSDFYEAFGQYTCYDEALEEQIIDRTLYLAISGVAYKRIMAIPFFAVRLQRMRLIIVNVKKQKILQWIR